MEKFEYSIKTKVLYSKNKKINKKWFIQRIATKPKGLWYSWGNCWASFLTESDWGRKWIKKYKYAHKLVIDYSRILKIRKMTDFAKFTKKFGIPCSKIRVYNGPNWQGFDKGEYEDFKFPSLIDWVGVSLRYDGIDIRFNLDADENYFWYNGWDVSSGCIWNMRCIKKTMVILDL